MSGPEKRFPLNLSSLDSTAKKPVTVANRPLAGRQTAARNAASAASAASGLLPVAERNGQQRHPDEVRVSGIAHGATGSLAGRVGVSSDVSGRKADVRQQTLVSDGVRYAMVERITRQGVRDPLVLAAMQAVLRHTFIDSGLVSQAYIDASLPIGHQQTISQPYIVARMIELMRENLAGGPLLNVLEIGTGCGYQAAVLSKVATQVYSIERIRPLHELAKNNLRPYRIPNLRLHYGDGMLGLPAAGPFDGIILAAAGMDIPDVLLQQMTVGGRLVAPVGGKAQVLRVIERCARERWVSRDVESCHFVPLLSGTV